MPGAPAPSVVVGAPPQVDVPTAKELIEQIHQHLSVQQLAALVAELEQKVAAMRALLALDALDRDHHHDHKLEREPDICVRDALELTFVARRRASEVMGARSDAELSAWVADLLAGGEPLAARFDRFCAAGPLAGGPAAELASELLHFGDPERYWLWSRWIWSPASRTGALPLLIGEGFALSADGPGATYERVGEAMRVLDGSPEAGAFRSAGGGRLATDVLLACSYAIYMRTVLGMKLTQEFNALVPPMAQLVRRLLGTLPRGSAQGS
ncbi:MAG: hypothetical protein ACLP01_01625 [Solirubrobacteraceae bacterium]